MNTNQICQFFLARHGDYSTEGKKLLTENGKKQIEILANEIRNIMGEDKITVFSSTSPRAIESTEIISNKVNCENIYYEDFLWSANDGPEKRYDFSFYQSGNKVIEKMLLDRSPSNGNYLIMTHLEIAKGLMQDPSYPLWGYNVRVAETLKKGQALYINRFDFFWKIIPNENNKEKNPAVFQDRDGRTYFVEKSNLEGNLGKVNIRYETP